MGFENPCLASRIEKEEFYTDDWRWKSHKELANKNGVGVAERIYLLKDIDGLYAYFFYEDNDGTQGYYVQIEKTPKSCIQLNGC